MLGPLALLGSPFKCLARGGQCQAALRSARDGSTDGQCSGGICSPWHSPVCHGGILPPCPAPPGPSPERASCLADGNARAQAQRTAPAEEGRVCGWILSPAPRPFQTLMPHRPGAWRAVRTQASGVFPWGS